MNKLLLLLCTFVCTTTVFSQENEMGAIKTKNGILIYSNTEKPFTINLEGKINLDQSPIIHINDNIFQFIQNSLESHSTDKKQHLKEYMNWEAEYLNDMLPEKVGITSEFIEVDKDIVNFWYFKNPLVKDAPEDITAVVMTFYLDWEKDGILYRLVSPSLKKEIPPVKDFLLNLKNNFRYYQQPLDLKKLTENIKKDKNFYKE